jgi:hypothetical protein
MKLSRRPLFFLAVAGAALLLYEPTPPELRWINMLEAGLALFWFVLLSIEELLRQRGRKPRPQGDRS